MPRITTHIQDVGEIRVARRIIAGAQVSEVVDLVVIGENGEPIALIYAYSNKMALPIVGAVS